MSTEMESVVQESFSDFHYPLPHRRHLEQWAHTGSDARRWWWFACMYQWSVVEVEEVWDQGGWDLLAHVAELVVLSQ